jgi:L1 cell adhesion molecule like protein
MKNTLNEEKLKEQFTEDDKKTIEETSNEGLQWLEANGEADADAIEGKRKEIEAKFSPIMQRVYAAAGGAPGGMPGMPGGAGFPGGGMPDMSGAGAAGTAGADGVDDLD